MSETVQILEPFSVPNEATNVKGNIGFSDSFSEEHLHEISEPVTDLSNQELKVDVDTQHDTVPLNGDYIEQEINVKEDLINEDELPPPPELVSEMPPPPIIQTYLLSDFPMESSVDPLILESNVDPEDHFNQSEDFIDFNKNRASKDETEAVPEMPPPPIGNQDFQSDFPMESSVDGLVLESNVDPESIFNQSEDFIDFNENNASKDETEAVSEMPPPPPISNQDLQGNFPMESSVDALVLESNVDPESIFNQSEDFIDFNENNASKDETEAVSEMPPPPPISNQDLQSNFPMESSVDTLFLESNVDPESIFNQSEDFIDFNENNASKDETEAVSEMPPPPPISNQDLQSDFPMESSVDALLLESNVDPEDHFNQCKNLIDFNENNAYSNEAEVVLELPPPPISQMDLRSDFPMESSVDPQALAYNVEAEDHFNQSEDFVNFNENSACQDETEAVSELPPPPISQKNLPSGFPLESSVDPIILESNVDPEGLIDLNENVAFKDETDANSGEYSRHVEYLSEGELVSDEELELQVTIKNNWENEVAESLSESHLIDSTIAEATYLCSSVQQMDAAEISVQREPLHCENELVTEEVQDEVFDEPSEVTSEQIHFLKDQQLEQTVIEVSEQSEFLHIVQEKELAEPSEVTGEQIHFQQERAIEYPVNKVPDQFKCVLEPAVDTETEETHLSFENKSLEIAQSRFAYSEPDIVIDNKLAEELCDQTPPPPQPAPLEEETPTQAPPLNDNIPLRCVSCSSVSSKQSPVEEFVAPLTETSSVTVAVGTPQPEPKIVALEPKWHILLEVSQAPNSEVLTAHVQPPVAVVAPQVVTYDLSPSNSPSIPSEHLLSDVEKAETKIIAMPQVSQKVNKKNYKTKIRFGVGLIEAALKELTFINNVNKHTGLYKEWLFKKAIRRYEAFWLPLAAEHKKEILAAPLDIEWVWHCHMLAPVAYEADCKSQVGLLVDHKTMDEKDRTKALERSRKYWTAKYPNETFDIDLVLQEKVEVEPQIQTTEQEKLEDTVRIESQAVGVQQDKVKDEVNTSAENGNQEPADNRVVTGDIKTEDTTNEAADKPESPYSAPVQKPVHMEPFVPEEGYQQRSSYDIFSAITRQHVFYYQTSLAHFRDKCFLKSALKRYRHFLFLKHQNPTETLVPCYDIDLILHAHQLHPSVYKHDTTKLLGQTLNHDDSVNNRVTGPTLNHADHKTLALWTELFGDTYMMFGAMYRGKPPILCERMSIIVPEETYSFSTKKATVNLDKVRVEGLPEEVNKFSVRLAIGGSEKDGPIIKLLKGNTKKYEFENTKKGLAHFVFDTRDYDRIKFNLHQQLGFACTGHDKEIGEQTYTFMPVVENIPMEKTDAFAFTDTIVIDGDQNLKITFTVTIEPPKQGPTMLYMNPGNYETRFCIMPEQMLQMWGPILLARLPSGRDSHCTVASHRFVNHTGEVTFTCRVIHSLPLVMSAVQVFYKDRMTAVAHLVGVDQIPLPSQLSDSKKIFSLNPKDEQRAVLIKNQIGDWGLLRGQWIGFRKFQPAIAATKGKKAKKEVQWNPGTLSVSFYKCATGAWQHVTLPYQQDNYKLDIQEASVDLKSGTVEINSESNQVAENLALAMSVALLHIVCQPRYTPPAPPKFIPVTVDATLSTASSPPEALTQEMRISEQGQEPFCQEKDSNKADSQTENGAKSAAVQVAEEKLAEPVSTHKTPKSPNKSEPSTPSKNMKEIPPIPVHDLTLVMAAGYAIDTPTTANIKKIFGTNACVDCLTVGMDVGNGCYGKIAADAQAESETSEAIELVAGTMLQTTAIQ